MAPETLVYENRVGLGVWSTEPSSIEEVATA